MSKVPPRSPRVLCEEINHQLQFDFPGLYLSKGLKGAITGALNKHLGGDANRRLVLGFLFGDGKPLSSHALSESQWLALSNWVGLWHDEEAHEWRVIDNFPFEAAQVLTEVIRAHPGEVDPLVSHAVTEIGGTITRVEDGSVLSAPKFDGLIQQTTFGDLIFGDKDQDAF